MPICPVDRKTKVEGPCNNFACYLNVPTLDYRCLQIHSKIYNKNPIEILTDLYGKPFKMTVALSIKATRIAYAMKEIKPSPNREILYPIEKDWVRDIREAGPLLYSRHWTVLTSKNKKFKFRERMLQVLHTMETDDYSLRDLLEAYNILFYKVDYAAFCIPEERKKEAEELMRSER